MVAFPPLLTPIESNYRACTIPYRFPSDNPKKPTPTELQWIDLFLNSIPSFKKRAESDTTVPDAPVRAEKFAQRYGDVLEDFKKDPESHGGPPDCILLCRLREIILRELGFIDIFKRFKDEENAKAISLFKDVVQLNDAIEDDSKRLENLVRGIFAGNIFNLGSAELAEVFSKDGMSFLASCQNLVPRPWVIDDLDAFKVKWSKKSWKKVVIFVDNSGADIILGILPFARELLRHGTQVVLAANDMPSINDVTYTELIEIIAKLKDENRQLMGVDMSNLSIANSGNDLPVIDLTRVSQLLAYLASDADLVVLEGMGRGIETNLYAQFKCDSLKIGMVKHPEVAQFLGGRLYDCVFKYNEVINTAQPTPQYQQSAEFLISQAKLIGLEFQSIEFVPNKPLILLKWPGSDPTLPSILLNSHTDVVTVEQDKWVHHPFGARLDSHGNIFARGSQDMKCVGMQYLEAIRRLKSSGFVPLRSVYLSFVPDEEIGGHDGAEKFADSDIFNSMNVGIVLDEGLASPGENYRIFYAERCPWWLVIKATGAPGHGAKLYDNSAMENLLKSIESVRRFRASQFDMVKAGLKAEGEVISVNMVFLKAGTPPTGLVMNLQPSEAEAGFDIRVPPTADPESLERRIVEEWAPASRYMTFQFMSGRSVLTKTDSSNPWWNLLEEAVRKANGKLGKPEIFPASTDARYFRQLGLPAFGFSPMANTPKLLHDHNEFLNQDEYLKGIRIYESIIKAYASYTSNGGFMRSCEGAEQRHS
ncbi:hypothetical protein OIU77_015276 [Salix suchowensis]|uniref:N-acyl-aliphatic-L-amino acid amidohydrolase n=1 Tax=Salix suchowensis TaxID=1278906 RepID=A0ABQ8ZS85_9ROSI|nr:hypothetical protein OIU77_015276 [Salix suchowensis]